MEDIAAHKTVNPADTAPVADGRAQGDTPEETLDERSGRHWGKPLDETPDKAPRPDAADAGRHAAARVPDPFRVTAAIALVLLVAALIPLFAICPFDHSYADDWHYGVDAHLALAAGGGLWEALVAAAKEAYDTFFSWQGTYSAIFLMALQPGVFSEAAYGIGAAAIIVALVAATAYLARVLAVDAMGADAPCWITLACLALLLQTQLLPSPVEGFYWYNAAIYYTFYHALALIMAGLCARIILGRTRRGELSGRSLAWRAAVLFLLSAFVAGGNFVTGLVAAMGLFLACAVAIWRRIGRARYLVPALVIFMVGFAVSMAAPGNTERQLSQFPGDNLGVVMTLARSVLAGLEYTVLWTNGYLVVALLLALPVMVRAARRSSCSFACPLGVVAVSFALFMASFAPTFYSMGTVGPGRVQNIRYDLFVVLVFICVQWAVGRIVRVADGRAGAPRDPARPALYSSDRVHLACVMLLCSFIVCSTLALAVDSRHADELTSVSAAQSLASGEAARYSEEVWERFATIEASDEADLHVPYYTVYPHVLYMGDIRDNMDNYINYRLSQWFGKDSIIGYNGVIG